MIHTKAAYFHCDEADTYHHENYINIDLEKSDMVYHNQNNGPNLSEPLEKEYLE